MLHEPARGLGTEEDTTEEDEGWNERRAELKAPCDSTSVFDNDVGAETEEDTCRGPSANVGQESQATKLTCHDPELPEHDKSTSNSVRGHLGRVDGDGGILRTDTDTHDKAGREQSLPRLCESGTNRGCGETGGSQENLASSTKVVVEGIDDEGTTGTGQLKGIRAGVGTHMRPAVKKMMELMSPTIHSSLPVPTRPNSSGKDKLAPLAPV